jgi:exosome complex RNA-binding protein Csl4
MSVCENRNLTCPHCQHEEARSVAVSLNGARAAQ